MNIKNAIIEVKNKKISAIERQIFNLKQEIFENQTEIEDLQNEIEDIKKSIEEVENTKDENSLGHPSIVFKKGDVGLTEAQAKDANLWVIQHELECHNEDFFRLREPRYQGAVGCAHYEISWGFTSIGDLAEIICTDCKQRYSLGEA